MTASSSWMPSARRTAALTGSTKEPEDASGKTEVDHVVPVSNGGITTQENGRLYCAFHHRLHHRENHPGFRVREDAR